MTFTPPDGSAPFFDLIHLIQQNHPDIFSLLNQPGVLNVALQIVQAEQQGKPWSAEQIQAALQATPYYQSTSQGQRSFDILLATDPATARQQMSTMGFRIRNMATELGITLNDSNGLNGGPVGSEMWNFAQQAIGNGWDDSAIRAHLVTYAKTGAIAPGLIGDTMVQLRKDAQDYGVPVSDDALFWWSSNIAGGVNNKASFDDYLVGQAKSLYPTLGSQLDSGSTVRQLVDPYLQIAHQELGIDPSTVQLTDPKWNAAINTIDPKTNTPTMMSLSDWTAKVRTDPMYGYDKTIQAQTQAAAFAKQLATQMGAVG